MFFFPVSIHLFDSIRFNPAVVSISSKAKQKRETSERHIPFITYIHTRALLTKTTMSAAVMMNAYINPVTPDIVSLYTPKADENIKRIKAILVDCLEEAYAPELYHCRWGYLEGAQPMQFDGRVKFYLISMCFDSPMDAQRALQIWRIKCELL